MHLSVLREANNARAAVHAVLGAANLHVKLPVPMVWTMWNGYVEGGSNLALQVDVNTKLVKT